MSSKSLVLVKSGEVLCRNVFVAHGIHSLIGLMGRSVIGMSDAFVINGYDKVHTFFMRFSLGVVFIDAVGAVLHCGIYAPWRSSRRYKKTAQIIEIHPSHIESGSIKVGDIIAIQ
jgi:uncharacterized protein